MFKILTNGAGDGDWVVFQKDGETLWEGHRIDLNTLTSVILPALAGEYPGMQNAVSVRDDLTNEQMENREF